MDLYTSVLFLLFCFPRNSADEKPLNALTQLMALKSSITASPLENWVFKHRFKSLADISLTPRLLRENLVERPATKDRLRKVMRRALHGRRISVVVMGGSISAGGGFDIDHENINGIYYRVFIDWWHTAVEPFTHSKVQLHNLSIGGTASNFFAFCYKTLTKRENGTDFVFLDFTVNDYAMFRQSPHPMSLSLEQLTREILTQANSSAIFFINFVQGSASYPVCDNLENHGQTALAWHYGITSLSMRSSVCPNDQNSKFPTMFSSDGNHASVVAHAQIALALIENVRNALLAAIEDLLRGSRSSSSSFLDLPAPVFSMNAAVANQTPLCFTRITPDVSRTMGRASLSVKELRSTGFQRIDNLPIKAPGQIHDYYLRTDGYGGWKAETVNSSLELKIYLPLTGNVTRKIVLAVRTDSYGAAARVWLEKHPQQQIIISTRSPYGHTRLVEIAHHVKPGSHVLHVNIIKPKTFLLCGVMVVEESAVNG